MPALISCIVPAFNAGRYLADLLQSIVDQSYRPIEIVVVDDGSTDDTAAVARRFPEVRVVSQENGGPAAARNRGVSESAGPFIAFQDADDIWDPGKLLRQFVRFEQRPELDLCTCQIENFWNSGIGR